MQFSGLQNGIDVGHVLAYVTTREYPHFKQDPDAPRQQQEHQPGNDKSGQKVNSAQFCALISMEFHAMRQSALGPIEYKLCSTHPIQGLKVHSSSHTLSLTPKSPSRPNFAYSLIN